MEEEREAAKSSSYLRAPGVPRVVIGHYPKRRPSNEPEELPVPDDLAFARRFINEVSYFDLILEASAPFERDRSAS